MSSEERGASAVRNPGSALCWPIRVNRRDKSERLVQEQLPGRETGQERGDRQQVGAAAGAKVTDNQFIIQLAKRLQTAVGQHTAFPQQPLRLLLHKIQPFKPAARHQVGVVIPGHQVQQGLQ